MYVESYLLKSAPGFPNNAKLPLLLYRRTVSLNAVDPAATFERLFTSNGWGCTWRNGIYPFHHFHPDANEVLGIANGNAKVQFGGPNGPIVEVEAGDVAVLPAGTAHKRIEASTDLLVVGAYPKGQEQFTTMQEGDGDEVIAMIGAVGLPAMDPVFGAEGPVVERWN